MLLQRPQTSSPELAHRAVFPFYPLLPRSCATPSLPPPKNTRPRLFRPRSTPCVESHVQTIDPICRRKFQISRRRTKTTFVKIKMVQRADGKRRRCAMPLIRLVPVSDQAYQCCIDLSSLWSTTCICTPVGKMSRRILLRLVIVAVRRLVLVNRRFEEVSSIAGPRILVLPDQGAALLLLLPRACLRTSVLHSCKHHLGARRATRSGGPYNTSNMSPIARLTSLFAQSKPRRLISFVVRFGSWISRWINRWTTAGGAAGSIADSTPSSGTVVVALGTQKGLGNSENGGCVRGAVCPGRPTNVNTDKQFSRNVLTRKTKTLR